MRRGCPPIDQLKLVTRDASSLSKMVSEPMELFCPADPMAEYRKIQPPIRHRATRRPRPDGSFWAKFTKVTSHALPGAVVAVDFSPSAPHDILVTSSARVSLVSGRSCKITKSFTRFAGPAFSGVFRPTNGRLMAAADETGVVSVFDISSRTALRQFKGHKAATRVVRWRADGLALFSGSDDKTVRYWDLATGTVLGSCKGHTDYVRCGAVNSASHDVFISGSYDNKLCTWDMREGGGTKPVRTYDHGMPVESCIVLPGGSVMLSAGGDTVKVWDLLGSGNLIHSFSNHAKTVTCLAANSDATRLLSASLDGHVKIYDVQSYDVVHSLRFSGALLSMGLSPDNSKIVVGRADGSLSIRQRESALKPEVPTYKKPMFGGTMRYFQSGKNAVAGHNDFQVELHKRQRLAPYDNALRGFRYHDALDQALESRNPRTIVAVAEELILRKGLKIALAGRDEAGLEPLLAFLVRYINIPDFSETLHDTCNMVLDMYSSMVGQSQVVDEMLKRLMGQVKAEVALQKELSRLVGAMDLVMATHEHRLDQRVGLGGDKEKEERDDEGVVRKGTKRTRERAEGLADEEDVADEEDLEDEVGEDEDDEEDGDDDGESEDSADAEGDEDDVDDEQEEDE